MGALRKYRSVGAYAALFLTQALTLAVPVGLALAQEAPAGSVTEYRDVPGIGLRRAEHAPRPY